VARVILVLAPLKMRHAWPGLARLARIKDRVIDFQQSRQVTVICCIRNPRTIPVSSKHRLEVVYSITLLRPRAPVWKADCFSFPHGFSAELIDT